jgi:hypothetical protein
MDNKDKKDNLSKIYGGTAKTAASSKMMTLLPLPEKGGKSSSGRKLSTGSKKSTGSKNSAGSKKSTGKPRIDLRKTVRVVATAESDD